MLIGFNGIDGSGKSFQAHRLVDRLNAEGYPAIYVWAGNNAWLSRPLIRLGRRMMGAVKTQPSAPPVIKSNGEASSYRAYLSKTQRLFRQPSLRNMWLHKALFEHMTEIWTTFTPHLAQQKIIVCDRYIYDTIINIAVLSNLKPTELVPLLRLPHLYRVPQPVKWFFLDIPPEVAYKRKNDIPDILFLQRRVPLYHAAAKMLGFQWMDGTADPDTLTEEIWRNVTPLLPQRSAPVSK